jgi:hypothetical protein
MKTEGHANQNDGPAEEILNNIDPLILQSFTPEQVTEIRQVINQNWPQSKKHLFDIHSSISFFIRRFYFVFSLGRDTRCERAERPVDRRKKTSPRDIFLSSLTALFFLAFLVFIYWIHPS